MSSHPAARGTDEGRPETQDLKSLVRGVVRFMVGSMFDAYAAVEDSEEHPLEQETFAVALAKRHPQPGEDLSFVQGFFLMPERLLYIEVGPTPASNIAPREMKDAGLNPPGAGLPGGVENTHNLWRTFEMETHTADEVADELVALMERLHSPFDRVMLSQAKLRLLSMGGEIHGDADRRAAADPRYRNILIEVEEEADGASSPASTRTPMRIALEIVLATAVLGVAAAVASVLL